VVELQQIVIRGIPAISNPADCLNAQLGSFTSPCDIQQLGMGLLGIVFRKRPEYLRANLRRSVRVEETNQLVNRSRIVLFTKVTYGYLSQREVIGAARNLDKLRLRAGGVHFGKGPQNL